METGGESGQAAARSRLALLGAALLFSTGGAAIKLTAFTTWQVACFRSAVAAVVLAVLLPVTWGRDSWRAVPVGCAYATTMLLFVAGNKLTTAANTIFLQSTAPLYLLLLAPWVLREPVQRRDVLFMASVAAGLVTILAGGQPALDSAPNPALGNAVAACSGVSWAFTLLGLRWASQAPGADLLPTALVAGNLLTFLVALPLAFPVERASAADGAIVAYLGVFQIGLAYVCLGSGVRRVSALEASLILLLEPALNPLWAWLVHGEAPGLQVLIGGVAILAATTVRTAVDVRRRPES